MLISFPTKRKGYGLELYGDILTLKNISVFVARMKIFNPSHQIILDQFLKKLKRAKNGIELQKPISYEIVPVEKHYKYFGVIFTWPEIMLILSVLRHTASFNELNRNSLVILYSLEYSVENCLENTENGNWRYLKEHIGNIPIVSEYTNLFLEAIEKDFFNIKPANRRMLKLGEMFWDYLSPVSDIHKKLYSEFKSDKQDIFYIEKV